MLRPGTGLMRRLGSEVEWGYRWCGLGPSDIVLEATLALAHGERAAIDAQMEALLEEPPHPEGPRCAPACPVRLEMWCRDR